jgi:group I intron endonuclease
MEKKISGVYKIENTITGDFYIGSSIDVKRRWRSHKWSSTWKLKSNSPMYKDMQKYGIENFEFTILVEVESKELTIMEQKMIEELRPTYNKQNAYGIDVERYKQCQKEYQKTDKYKESQRKRRQSDKGKERNRKQARKDMKKYSNQLCFYNGETLTLAALSQRFRKVGIKNPTSEAKKYLIKVKNN